MTTVGATADGLEQIDDRIDINAATHRDLVFDDNFDHASIPFEKEEWPVLIVGSSLVGMLTGLLLGYHGVPNISFDKHPTILAHPRATGLDFKTVEILRQLGLEDICFSQRYKEVDLEAGLLIVDSLVGGKIHKVVQDHIPERDLEVTPTKWLWLTQAMLEPILLEYGPKYNYNPRYRHEVVHYEEQEDGVIVVVKDLDNEKLKKYKTQYLVACDGNRSPTRRKEGILMQGRGVIGHGVNIRFRADLHKLMGPRVKHGILYLARDDIKGGFRQEEYGKAGLLWVHEVDGKHDFPPGSVTREDAERYLRMSSGLGDEPGLELLSFAHWTLASVTATRFASKGGRVLIAGDAAHVMPPTGALGGNTGCLDAHNLAWKLAYVVSGRASHSLLQSYDLERRPVDAFVVDQATRRLNNRVRREFNPMPEETYMTVEVGGRYKEGALIHDEHDPVDDRDFEDPHNPSGRAGTRFPHVALSTADETAISTIDLVRSNFVIIATEDKSPWIAAAQGISEKVDGYTLHENSQPYRDLHGKMRQRANLGVGEALLVRPDVYIAWRAPRLESGHKEALQKALSQVLGKQIL